MEGKHLGHYQLYRRLGEGGMGTVYLARDTQLERDVAIKVIAPDLVGDPDLVARFRVEAIAQARLSHPNIVTIHSFSETDGTYIIVMEYVPGKTLKQIIKEKGRLPLQNALSITLSILDALSFAHSQGILHRDIKPANILVTPDGKVKLGDFGIAKIEGLDGLTRVGTTLGTPHYSSPEQIRGIKPTPATDFYALSVTLFEMLTGNLPFGGGSKSNLEIQKAHLEKTAPPPSSISPSLPPRLDAIIAKGLSKNPADRFRSAREFSHALAALRTGHPGLSLPGLSGILSGIRRIGSRLKSGIRPSGFPENNKRWLIILLVPLLLLLLILVAVAAGNGPSGATGDNGTTFDILNKQPE